MSKILPTPYAILITEQKTTNLKPKTEGITMKMTSAQAAKQLRKLSDRFNTLTAKERSTSTFLASLGEDVESLRPEYDYAAMQKQQAELETQIRRLRHAINIFNTTTVIPEYGFTIDEMLVFLPQLSNRVKKLGYMRDALPKAREENRYTRGGSIIDYRYANYDIRQAEADYQAAADELAKAQTALDVVNNTVEFDFIF